MIPAQTVDCCSCKKKITGPCDAFKCLNKETIHYFCIDCKSEKCKECNAPTSKIHLSGSREVGGCIPNFGD